MSTYEVNTPDGVTHRITAVTHTRDSNGLTLTSTGGAVVGLFPQFNWMRVVESTVSVSAPAQDTTQGQEQVASPAATGE